MSKPSFLVSMLDFGGVSGTAIGPSIHMQHGMTVSRWKRLLRVTSRNFQCLHHSIWCCGWPVLASANCEGSLVC